MLESRTKLFWAIKVNLCLKGESNCMSMCQLGTLGRSRSLWGRIWTIFRSFWTILSKKILSFLTFLVKFHVRFWSCFGFKITQKVNIFDQIPSKVYPRYSFSNFQSIWIIFESFLTILRPNFGPVFMENLDQKCPFVRFLASKSLRGWLFSTFKLPKPPRHSKQPILGPETSKNGLVFTFFMSNFDPQISSKFNFFMSKKRPFSSVFCLKHRSDPQRRVDWPSRSIPESVLNHFKAKNGLVFTF